MDILQSLFKYSQQTKNFKSDNKYQFLCWAVISYSSARRGLEGFYCKLFIVNLAVKKLSKAKQAKNGKKVSGPINLMQ